MVCGSVMRLSLIHICIGTEWGEKLDPQNVLPEYPRPQMTRTQVQDGWQNLNGLWNYAILQMCIRDRCGISAFRDSSRPKV